MSALERIDYADGASALTGWLARPSGPARSAVVVYPTIMNPTPAVEAKALALAEQGYLALIADFYGEPVADFGHSVKLATALRGDVDQYRARLRAALVKLTELAPELPQVAIGCCQSWVLRSGLLRQGQPTPAPAARHCWPARLPDRP